MSACSSAFWTIFVKAGIKPHFIYLTVGEFGIHGDSELTPPEMAKIRRQEIEHAAALFGATLTILEFVDTRLKMVAFETLIKAVLPLIREIKPDALFSFNDEAQLHINHPDHRVTAQVAEYVADMANVKHSYPEYPAPTERPDLYLWTTHTEKSEEKIYSLPLTKKTRKKHNEYLKAVHPSQFTAENELEWTTIFEDISKDGARHTERYIKVR
jgi:LmbE family N-acetylglucosaminyl deacetylase